MDKETELVFVYGTLRVDASNHHRMRKAVHVMRGTVRGRLYQIDWYPGFVPDEAGYEVEGDVFGVDRDLLEELDHFEGLDPGELSGEEYERVRLRVRCVRKADVFWRDVPDELQAWVWVWRKPVTDLAEVPSGNWLNAEGVAARSWCIGFGCLGLIAIPVGGMMLVELLKGLSIVFDEAVSLTVLLLATSAMGLVAGTLGQRRRERARIAHVLLIAGSVLVMVAGMFVLSALIN